MGSLQPWLPAAAAGGMLPAYAGTRRNYTYDAARRIYLPNGFLRRQSLAALGKAGSGASGAAEVGGAASILCLGDSETAGRPNVLTSWPYRLRKMLQAFGYPIGGTGANGIDLLGAGPVASSWTLAGGMALSGSAFWMKSTTEGASGTYVSEFAGTQVDVWTFGNSGAFTVAIDGGAEELFTPGGVAGKVEKFTKAGLANAVHTVVVKSKTAGSTYIFAVNVHTPATGLEVVNFGASGTTTGEWRTPKATSFSLASQVQNLYPEPGIVVLSLGLNDMVGSVPLATYRANLEALVAEYQGLGADVYLVAQPMEESFSQATWEEWLRAQYEVADAKACGLYDAFAMTGSYTEASGRALMYDAIHVNAAVHWQTAKSVAAMIGATA